MIKTIWAFLLVIIPLTNSWSQDVLMNEEIPEITYDLMQDRLSCIESEISLSFNERVYSFADYFIFRNRDYTKKVISRSNVYFPIFEEVLSKYEMPEELKFLAIIESGLNPNAVSRVGAGGLWQFMPSTGLHFKLGQSFYIDERMDPWKSTDAACLYLKQLYHMFDDWELALAAYNAGPGNVRKAIRRSGYKSTFREVYKYLPRETRSYVPQFMAMIYVINYATEHNLLDLNTELNYLPEYDTILVSDYMHLETFAGQINLCVDDLIALNPQIVHGAIPEGTVDYALRVPLDLIDSIRLHKDDLLDSASKVGKKELDYLARNTPGSVYGRTKITYRVQSGDVLGKIAERYHVRVSDLKRWNNINSNMIRVGQRLNVWVLPNYSSNTRSSYVAKAKPVKPIIIDGKYHLVRSGDSLWSIANLYEGLTIEKLKKMNGMSSSRIKPGQKLLISM